MEETRREHGIRPPSSPIHTGSPQLGTIKVNFEQRDVREPSRVNALPRSGKLGGRAVDSDDAPVERGEHIEERPVAGPRIDGQAVVP